MSIFNFSSVPRSFFIVFKYKLKISNSLRYCNPLDRHSWKSFWWMYERTLKFNPPVRYKWPSTTFGGEFPSLTWRPFTWAGCIKEMLIFLLMIYPIYSY